MGIHAVIKRYAHELKASRVEVHGEWGLRKPCWVPGRVAEVLRRAKSALLRMTSLVECNQFEVGTPPYFCSHFNSSRTLILPCQGFFESEWPSPGKTRRLFGTPNE